MVTASNPSAVPCPTLSAADRERIAEAVATAEAGTAAEIVVAVETDPCEEADATVALALAGFLAIFSAGPLHFLGASFALTILLQAAIFAALAMLAASSRVRRALHIDRLPSAAAHEAAMRAFADLHVGATRWRTGVLIHVAVADRHVEVIADEGVHEAVAPETWRETVAAIASAARDDRLIDGIVVGVGRCGAALAEALPPAPGVGDELPNEPSVR